MYRPTIMGTHGMIAAGHYLAARAGLHALERGGNAVDAGVTAGIALNLLHPDMTNFAGVAPIVIYLAEERRTLTISGLGRWPRAATLERVAAAHGTVLKPGALAAVISAAPDAWLTALERYGTFTLEEVLEPAIEIAENGFPMYAFMRYNVDRQRESYQRWPQTREIFYPDGRLPEVGELFLQKDAARTLRLLLEAAAGKADRRAAIRAARDRFYRGDIARAMAAFAQAEGGVLTAEDMAEFQVQEEAPVVSRYKEYEIHACGPWSQGIAFPQILQILESLDLAGIGHNSPEYVHTVAAAIDLAIADREYYVGDPEFVPVPVAGMLSAEYARAQARRIDPQQAFAEMPPPGDPWRIDPTAWRGCAGAPELAPCRGPALLTLPEPARDGKPLEDTSYVAAVDQKGNFFSATPSDGCAHAPIVPGLGLPLSARARQSRLDPHHPARIDPWKRPRLTPSPVIIFRNGQPWASLGTPGADIQPQAMVQVFLNLVEFGMSVQDAIEAPRFGSYNFPGSFSPHRYEPGVLRLEGRFPEATAEALLSMGHRIRRWKDWDWEAGALHMVCREPNGLLLAGADPRREGYAIGW